MGIEIRKMVRGGMPRISFENISHRILGDHYELSLVICGDSLSQTINKKYRNKDYAPNVLSFPYSKHEGEIILNVRKAAQEARKLGISTVERVTFLFIHGCLHLKGLKHGKRMDVLERKFLKKAGF